jgi:protein TonB
MSTQAHPAPGRQPLGSGLIGAIVLHVAVAALLIGASFLRPFHKKPWGEDTASIGAIQASMVSAIPLPPKAPPVEKSVLASEDVTKAPEPPPVEKTAPPPKATDILVKSKPDKVVPKVAPKETPEPPKHPQPVAPSPKATSGDAATQLPQSISQTANGTATVTVQNRSFGNRYAYYLRIVGSTVTRNYNEQHPDPRASQDKSVTLVFDIQRDGSPTNLRVETASGSSTLDMAARRAVLSVDSFGQLPEGDHITIEYKFDYHHP